MNGKKVLTSCQPLIEKIVTDLGLVLVDLEYKKLVTGMTLIVYIDKPEGVTLDDCEMVSRALDKPLDELDPTDGASYNLNVSSPGLDRPIKTDYDFNKYKGKEVTLKFYVPYEKSKTLDCVLQGHTDSEVLVNLNGKDLKFDKEKIALITPVIKF
ncbi:MAG: ribosome maturation factor RimP [Clostridia bacterium]|nr:ribosome maturation factor RimP [Clostridia bacterium]